MFLEIIVISQKIILNCFFNSFEFFFFPHFQLFEGILIFLCVIFIFLLIIVNYENKNNLIEYKKTIHNYYLEKKLR